MREMSKSGEAPFGCELEDSVVIVRCAGERTEAVSLDRARAQFWEGSKVTSVSERPFARSLERSIEIALDSGRRFALFLDADVLLRCDGRAIMGRATRSVGRQFYKIGFQVLDWGFCGPTYAGVHLYCTEKLAQARRYVKRAYFEQRPETYLCMEMGREGVPTILRKEIVGLHDYEQYYRDIYRKNFVRACKFKKRVGYLLARCVDASEGDAARHVMLHGLTDGLLHHTESTIAPLDSTWYAEKAERVLRDHGLDERRPLDYVEEGWIEGLIDGFQPDNLYLRNTSWLSPEVEVQWFGRRRGMWNRVRGAMSMLKRGVIECCRELVR